VTVQLTVDGRQVEVARADASLLEVLRDELGVRSPKDGCSPQGQCGCCTVLVDGQPRVACVTPVRRVAGREVVTLDGLDEGTRAAWGEAFCAAGASQCGFCTPGIVVRLEGLRSKGASVDDEAALERALAAHLCRCTGWRTIGDAWRLAVPALAGAGSPGPAWPAGRDRDRAERRAALEGRTTQRVGPEVALGHGGFAEDTAPAEALVAVPDGVGGWTVGETLGEARRAAGKVQGRRSSVAARPPLAAPPGEWPAVLRTSWVEPAYLETDAAWCEPGGEPAGPLANGGAFGGKVASPVVAAARTLARSHGRAVRVVLAREDVVRLGPKRPPVAGAAAADGTGVLRVVATDGIAEAVATVAPGLVVEQVAVPGPPTSAALRAAGWAEAAVLVAAATGATVVRSPEGAEAEAEVGDGTVRVRVRCGDPLDEVVLRSYCVGAAHMALGWVTSEGLAVDDDGEVHDLTIRSFGVLRAADTPPVEVEIDGTGPGEPVNGSDAVFAAVALAVWRHQGLAPDWPTGTSLRGGG
jgi:aerobic-type carbon monoxide dehydrogenase small subunit (CoxS/CutS family)